MAINRQDGRHWCDPWSHPDAGGLVVCECGKQWVVDRGVYREVVPEPLPDETDVLEKDPQFDGGDV